MALSDIRIFQWYQKYIVKAADMTNLQIWLRGMFEGMSEGAFGGAVLQGLKPSISSGLTVSLDAGIAVSPTGRIMVITAATSTFASPAGSPAKSLVVARPKLTDMTQIPEPINPTNQVYLYKKFEYDLIVINGTPAANPAYPSVQAEDVIVCGVTLAAGQTTLTLSDIDFGKIDRPRKRSSKVLKVLADYTGDGSEEIVEIDASAGSAVFYPVSPELVPGQTFTFVKTDSSSNVVAVSGYEMSGQLSVEMDSQWQSLTIYSNGQKYRSI